MAEEFTLPAAIQGWEAFEEFARTAKSSQRYFRTAASEAFLNRVSSLAAIHEVDFQAQKRLWRARLGYIDEPVQLPSTEDGLEVFSTVERPYPPDQMKPLSGNWSSEGRANPRGISYIYLASSSRTAMAEVRPWIHSYVSIGEFELTRAVKLVDCSTPHRITLRTLEDDGTYDDGMWLAVNRAFAKPVARNDDIVDYIATQVIAEFLKAQGYDGLIYTSMLEKDGKNVVLFDVESVNLVSCELMTVTDIKFSYRDRRSGYPDDASDSG